MQGKIVLSLLKKQLYQSNFMQKIVIHGKKKLKGIVRVSGSKNSTLPLMTACLLTDELCELSSVPDLADIKTLEKLLQDMGVRVVSQGQTLKLHAEKLVKKEALYELVRTMRASILVLGPLLAREGYAKVSLPGGCAIGARPVDLHLKALEEMGASIKLEAGYIHASGKLKGAKIVFDQITVTGTANIMMAATLAEGVTVLENAACEPEIEDLANFLKKMGAKINGIGTHTLSIEGVKKLHGAKQKVIPDRIEAGTFMIAAALTEGDVIVENVIPKHVEALTQKLIEAGTRIEEINKTSLRVIGAKKIHPVNIVTAPYPGFATDFQAQFMALMALAHGSCLIKETIFENRFMHALELIRLGADLKIDGNTVFVTGVKQLQGASVMATDLRASASLVLAGLAAQGKTEIHRVYHIDRGYEKIEEKLQSLGATIERVTEKQVE